MQRRRIFRRIALTALAGAMFVVGGAWRMGSMLIAPAPFAVGLPPTDLSVEATTISSDSGAQLATWYIPAEGSTATAVLLHPIRGNRLSMLSRARMFHRHGFAVALIDQQAHGESTGSHMTAGCLERHDARAAVAYARRRNPSHRIIVLGRSLGGAAALLGSPLEVDAMVLEAVYPEIAEAVENRIAMRLGPAAPVLVPLLLWQVRPRLGFDVSELRPIDKVAHVGCPVLVIGGERDEHTTLTETCRLYAAAREPKRLVVFTGAAHVDLYKFDEAKYECTIMEFLDEALGR